MAEGVSANIAVRDVVLLMDKIFHRSDWPKAIVMETEPGPDGFIQTTIVRTSNGSEYKQDIRKLALLEAAEDVSATVTSTKDQQPVDDEPPTSTQLRRSQRLKQK